jgi:DNA-binding PadR family transcriptional regulator
MTDQIGQFEQHVLLAVFRKHPTAYGVAIQDELRLRTGRTCSIGAIYTTLDRLERKGFVKAKQGEATAERGGRRKLYFRLTGAGRSTLQASLNATDALRVDTDFAPVIS